MKKFLSISPAGLTLLYPWLFAEKPFIGGYQSPCGGQKTKHNQLAISAIAATYLYLDNAGYVQLRFKKEGLIFKHNTVYVAKIHPMAGKHGYLTRKMENMTQGSFARLIDLVTDAVKVLAPEKYLLTQIYNYDLKNTYLTHNNKIDCRQVFSLRNQATMLSNIIGLYRSRSPELYKAVVDNAKKALGNMKEEEDYDFD